MAVNKNFLIKNGLEVGSQLFFANAVSNKVGVGSTAPKFELDVAGGIGATDIYVSGLSSVTDRLDVGPGGETLTAISGGGGTILVGVGTTNPTFPLEVRSTVSTGATALYVFGDARITGDLNVDDITFDEATINNLTVTNGTQTQFLDVTGISTFGGNLDVNADIDVANKVRISETLIVTGVTTFSSYVDINDSSDISGTLNVGGATTVGGYLDVNAAADLSGTLNVGGATTIGGYVDVNNELDVSGNLVVSGVSTLGDVKVSTGIVTAASGIVTYYGDGSQLSGVIGGIGINTEGGLVGFGVTYLHLKGAGVSTTFYSSATGIATVFFQGGGGGSASIGIGTDTNEAFSGIVTSGNLWYNTNLGRMFIYYYDGSSNQWVDAAPFNISGKYLSKFGDFMLAGLGVTVGTASTPSVYFQGDATTGFYSPSAGRFEVLSAGTGIVEINASGIDVTGISTSTSVSTGSVNSSGVVTASDFNSTSDRELKENITTVDDAVNLTQQLRGVRFEWKKDGTPAYGVIAQELEEVLPELVSQTNPKTVNYNGLIGVLIEAVKELSSEVEELKRQIQN